MPVVNKIKKDESIVEFQQLMRRDFQPFEVVPMNVCWEAVRILEIYESIPFNGKSEVEEIDND